MFVAEQQLTSLSPPKKPDGTVGFFAIKREIPFNQNMIARGYAAELSVARSTMPNYRKCATFMSLKILQK